MKTRSIGKTTSCCRQNVFISRGIVDTLRLNFQLRQKLNLHIFHIRKEKLSPSLDLQAYKTWQASNTGDEQSSEDTRQQPGTSDEPAGTVPSGNTTGSGPRSNHSREPSYPSSFAHIVELITTGQPIPGIQQIPDTVLTGHDTSSEKPKRLKPWEKETANTVE